MRLLFVLSTVGKQPQDSRKFENLGGKVIIILETTWLSSIGDPKSFNWPIISSIFEICVIWYPFHLKQHQAQEPAEESVHLLKQQLALVQQQLASQGL